MRTCIKLWKTNTVVQSVSNICTDLFFDDAWATAQRLQILACWDQFQRCLPYGTSSQSNMTFYKLHSSWWHNTQYSSQSENCQRSSASSQVGVWHQRDLLQNCLKDDLELADEITKPSIQQDHFVGKMMGCCIPEICCKELQSLSSNVWLTETSVTGHSQKKSCKTLGQMITCVCSSLTKQLIYHHYSLQNTKRKHLNRRTKIKNDKWGF